MIACKACEYVDYCNYAYTNSAFDCVVVLEKAQQEYADAISAVEEIANGIKRIEESYQD